MFGKKNKKKKKEYTAEDIYELCGVDKNKLRGKTIELNTYTINEFKKQEKDDNYSVHEYKANMVKKIASMFTKEELAFLTYFTSVANTMQKLGITPQSLQQQQAQTQNKKDTNNKNMYQ